MKITIKGTREEISGLMQEAQSRIDHTFALEERLRKIEAWVLADRAEALKKLNPEYSKLGDEPESPEPSAPEKDAKGSEIVIEGGTVRLIVH